MPDEDEVIKRSRAVRAQAESLVAWSEAVRETSLAILDRGVRLPFDLPEEPVEEMETVHP